MNAPQTNIEAVSVISAAQIEQARMLAATENRRLIETLETVVASDADTFLASLAVSMHYVPMAMREMHDLNPAFDVIAFALANKKECIAFRTEAGDLLLVFADVFNTSLPEWASEFLKQPFQWRLAHRSDIAAYLAQHEETMRAMDGIASEETPIAKTEDDEVVQSISLKSINEDTNPIVKLVNSTLYDALKSGASDIHLECTPSGLAIKYRIDGVITSIGGAQTLETAEQVISRVKVLSQLDISERRIPQDGRFKVYTQGREVDFRVSIMPSVFGEDAVLRVLDRKALSDEVHGLKLDVLGLDAQTMTKFRRLINEPYGMVLVTGPTGSGKTTTLYGAVSEVNHGHDKIITIEDPVEYQLGGVLQIPVNEKKGLTFARGLRSILRHDPDKIMVGEIRDPETAQIAIQAALTGHLVFTTVHANSVVDVIGRFIHMGVDPYNFVSAMNGIMAQRLVRKLCQHCAEPHTPSQQVLDESAISAEIAANMQFKEGKGCGQCRGTGYKGRVAIAELLVLNDEIREMIIAREPIRKLKEVARKNGMRGLRESAIEVVAKGLTSLEEINRVTFVA